MESIIAGDLKEGDVLGGTSLVIDVEHLIGAVRVTVQSAVSHQINKTYQTTLAADLVVRVERPLFDNDETRKDMRG